MTTRKSNFESLRIVAMLLIILGHSASHGVFHFGEGSMLMAWSGGSAINKAFSSLLLPGGAVGVGLFFMITGYFQINRPNFSLKKMICEVLFYGAVLSVIYLISTLAKGELNGSIFSAFFYGFFLKVMANPLSGGAWWYVTAYFLVMLLTPVLNPFLKKLSSKGFVQYLIFFCIIWYGISYLTDGTYIQAERGLFFYSLGAYIRLHMNEQKISSVGCIVSFAIAWFTGGVAYFLYGAVRLGTSISSGLQNFLALALDFYVFVIVTPVCAIALFLLFKGFEIGSNTLINTVASSTFGIYLIHDSNVLRSVIWSDIFRMDSKLFYSALYPVLAILISLLIFVICMLIDLARKKLIEKKMIEIANKVDNAIRAKIFE